MGCRFVYEWRRILVAESDIYLTKSVRISFIRLTKIRKDFVNRYILMHCFTRRYRI